jgi:hypothetical protein
MKAMIGVGRGIDQRRGNVGREVGVVAQVQSRTLWFSLHESLALVRQVNDKSRSAPQDLLNPVSH